MAFRLLLRAPWGYASVLVRYEAPWDGLRTDVNPGAIWARDISSPA
jgi:hypothetical protein